MSLNKLLIATALMVSVSGAAMAADMAPAPADSSAAAPAKVVKHKKHHAKKKAAAPAAAAAPAEGSAK